MAQVTLTEQGSRQRARIVSIGTSHQDGDGSWQIEGWHVSCSDFPGVDHDPKHPPLGGWWAEELQIIQRARQAWGDEVALDLAERVRFGPK